MENIQIDPLDRRPWAELPSLVLPDRDVDVRGWEVIGHDGQTIGTVVDLLVDVDRLTVDYLAVSTLGTAAAGAVGEVIVPVADLTRDDAKRRLLPGSGMASIKLHYRSTMPLVGWAAIAAVILMALAWAFGLLGS